MPETIRKIYNANKVKTTFEGVTLGVVLDTNDPQQMGRVRAFCSAWDNDSIEIKDLPWCMFVSPFGGVTDVGTRGPEDAATNGKIAYGAWHIPKVGSTVLVACVDNNPSYRIWMGCVYDQFLTHTLPHGRFLAGDDGPFSSNENEKIQPLSDNISKAFSSNKTFEWKTRAADFSVSAIGNDIVAQERTQSKSVDTKEGYDLSRSNPDRIIEGRKNLDSHVYSWTTPAFHSFSMDDRPKNSRMRFRSSSGHQIIMDDTNERIYIMTAEGENWIEMDQKGNVDIFSNRRVSIRATKDINLTSDETVRLHGKKGVHLSTEDGDIRFDSKNANVHFNVDKNLVINCIEHVSVKSKKADISTSDYLTLGASTKLNLKGSFTYVTGSDSVFINGSSSVLVSGSAIHLNGPSAPSAQSPSNESDALALWTNRVPAHEPWPRVIMKNPDSNTSHDSEFSASDDSVNKIENGEDLNRNKNWRR